MLVSKGYIIFLQNKITIFIMPDWFLDLLQPFFSQVSNKGLYLLTAGQLKPEFGLWTS